MMDDENSILPQANPVNLAEDWQLLAGYSPDNFFIPLFLCINTLLFAIGVAIACHLDKKVEPSIHALEERMYLLSGDVTTDPHEAATIKSHPNSLKWKCWAFWKCWKCNKVRINILVVVVVVAHICSLTISLGCFHHKINSYWLFSPQEVILLISFASNVFQAECKKKVALLTTAFRQGHSLVAILWPIPLEQIFFTRSQRIICYYCELHMALAVMGIFFGSSQEGNMAVSL